MMAAQEGASGVVTSEGKTSGQSTVPNVRQTLEKNKLANLIDVVDQDSKVAGVQGAFGNSKAQVVSCEVLSALPFGPELAQAIAALQEEKLTEDGAVMVPCGARVYVAPVECPLQRFHMETPLHDVSGFDLSHFNSFRRHVPMPVLLRTTNHRFLAEPTLAFGLNFDGSLLLNEMQAAANINIPAKASGTWNAVVAWYELDLCEGITLSSDPTELDALQAMQYLPDAMEVKEGEPLQFKVLVNQGEMRLKFNTPVTPATGEGANLLKWHWGMVNDGDRNGAYDAALRKALAKLGDDALVLDIGAGSGLLSMMAARAGAKQVVTYEAVDALVPIATKIIDTNGYGDKVTVVNKMSTAGTVGAGCDLPRKADLLVSEIVDVGLLGEHMLASVEHAIPNLLKPEAVMIPCSASVHACLIEIRPQPGIPGQAQKNEGFELPEMDKCVGEGYQQLRLQDYAHRRLTESFDVFEFDFYKSKADTEEREVELPVFASGVCDAVCFWFKLNLDEEINISTAPVLKGEEDTCWQQAIVWNNGTDEERTLVAGDKIVVGMKHDGLRVTFDVKFKKN